MALHLPHEPTPDQPGPHPAICLIVGFSVIVAGAILVHVVFNQLV